MPATQSVEISSLTDAQVREQAGKIMSAKAKQSERMKERNKAKRIYEKALLETAAKKNLLPKPTTATNLK